jgi:hypothetical protein
MSTSIWHPWHELPPHDRDSVTCIDIVIANDECMSTALFSPFSEKVSPFEWNIENGYRHWFAWCEGNFTRWAYVSDILNLE